MTKITQTGLVALLISIVLLPPSIDASETANRAEQKTKVEGRVPVAGSQSQNYTVTATSLSWQVISSGGTQATIGTDKVLFGTAVQTAIGEVTTPNYIIHQGFWQNFGEKCRAGDADGSGAVSLSDAVYIINYIFSNGPPPAQVCAADVNGDGVISIGDAVEILRLVFQF